MTDLAVRGGVCTGPGPCDVTPIGAGKNWVNRVGGLPLYIRAIAQALLRSGHGEAEAISIAVGTVKRWAAGGGKVTAATRARAAAAVAEWEKKKAEAAGSRDFIGESSSAGVLLPVAPVPEPPKPRESTVVGAHGFRGRDLTACAVCGLPAVAPIHNRKRPLVVVGERAAAGSAYSAGHPFFGNQYDAIASAQTPQQLALVLAALEDPHVSLGSAGHSASAAAGGAAGGGGGGKSAAKSTSAKHAAALAKKAASQKAAAAAKQAATVKRLKAVAAVAQKRAAANRQLAAHAKTPAARDAYRAKAAAYQAIATKAQAALLAITQPNPTWVAAAQAAADANTAANAKAAAVKAAAAKAKAKTGKRAHPAGGGLHQARQAHKQTFEDAAAQVEPRLHAAMVGLFDRQHGATVSRLAGNRGRRMLRAAQPPNITPPAAIPPDAAAVFDTAFWAAQTAKIVEPIYDAAARVGSARVAAQLDAPPGSLFAVGTILRARANRMAQTVTDTTFDQISAALADGVADHDTIAQLADRVQAVFAAARVRAETIARTETVGALNEAAHSYATNLPAGTIGSKEWLAKHDDRTRITHRLADGQTVPLHAPFRVGTSLLLYPGDPAAPADEVINCRCNLLYHPAPIGGAA